LSSAAYKRFKDTVPEEGLIIMIPPLSMKSTKAEVQPEGVPGQRSFHEALQQRPFRQYPGAGSHGRAYRGALNKDLVLKAFWKSFPSSTTRTGRLFK
jgi:hypothetical protein